MVGGRKRASAPLLSIILVFPLKFPRVLKLIRGCIGSSGNVRVGRLAIGLSWWNMEKLVFPGERRLYVKSFQLLMWSSFKASCFGYPNHIHTYIHTLARDSRVSNLRPIGRHWCRKYKTLHPIHRTKTNFKKASDSNYKWPSSKHSIENYSSNSTFLKHFKV
jgi:hypothetical protein